MDRVILHVDCNKFYASVECAVHPEIAHLPLAVSGNPDSRHGIILTANQAAAKLGIKTAETIWQAKSKCPELLLVAPNFPLYAEYSRLFKSICAEYTDRVESFGLDECWLDITANIGKRGNGKLVADEIRNRVKAELGLTVSIGVSFNKVFAKLGSDYKKPDAVTVISRDNFKNIVWPLAAENLLYVGKATKKKLLSRGIFTIGDMAKAGPSAMHAIFGKVGLLLYEQASGNESHSVGFYDSKRDIKSISNSTTTPRDLVDFEDIKLTLTVLAESVSRRLREQNLRCKTVSVSLRDSSLRSFSRQTSLNLPTSLSSRLTDAAMSLALENLSEPFCIRSIGLAASDLCSDKKEIQFDLFNEVENNEKKENLEKIIDSLKSRYGNSCVKKACILKDINLTGFDPYDENNIVAFKTDL